MDSWRIIDVGINMGRRELMKQSVTPQNSKFWNVIKIH
jgi:hypothetical protein